jgi:hypothetical protein
MQSSEAEEQTKKLAHRLGITLVRKGERDLISNGEKLVICDEETSSRRCGGQGSTLICSLNNVKGSNNKTWKWPAWNGMEEIASFSGSSLYNT